MGEKNKSLTDEQKWAILNTPMSVSHVDLARQLGTNLPATKQFRRRFIQLGQPWACSIQIIACDDCGKLSLVRSARHHKLNMCSTCAERHRSRERRAQGIAGWSHLREKAETDPEYRDKYNQYLERYHAQRERNRETLNAKTLADYHKHQDATSPSANRNRERWTVDEHRFVAEHIDESPVWIALQLGRSFKSVYWRKQLIRTGQVKEPALRVDVYDRKLNADQIVVGTMDRRGSTIEHTQTWHERNPDQSQALEKRERDSYESTLSQAGQHREYWSRADEDYLLANSGKPDEVVAKELGRTLYAVRSRRAHLIREGRWPDAPES